MLMITLVSSPKSHLPKGMQHSVLCFYENALILILLISGPPSATNYYLFNGDIVDKGQHSIEVSES